MVETNINWKSKIDPAFDKVVREYVEFLGELGANPREGRLSIPKDVAESLAAKMPAPALDDADLESTGDLFRYIEKLGGLTGTNIRTFFDLIDSLGKEDPNEIIKICAKMTKSLPEEESRAFYNKKLNSFKDNPELNKALHDFNNDSLDFLSIVLSLQARYLFTILFEDEKKEIDANINYLKKSNSLLPIISVLSSSFSQIAHQKTLADLKENISKGDDDSIFKAVTIDKSLLSMDEIKDRISKAQLSGDEEFFKELGKAIADNPLKSPTPHGKTYTVIRMFWLHGLYKLTYRELHGFLESCDLIPPAYPGAFEKFMHRNIKPIFSF
jgi:acyl carrier protein